MAEWKALEKAIGHTFQQPVLLKQALTHPSMGHDHNQRLEYLGDAVLELCVSEKIYEKHPEMHEGAMTRLRQKLVREEKLAEAAGQIHLGALLVMDRSCEISGGRENPSVLCDAFEAVLAAVYLDGGFDAADAIVDRLLGFFVRDAMRGDALDAKSRLQEMLQRQGIMPEYRQVSVEGPQHAPVYRYQALARESVLGEGEGRSKQAAQQQAAQNALDALRREKN